MLLYPAGVSGYRRAVEQHKDFYDRINRVDHEESVVFTSLHRSKSSDPIP